MSDREKIRIFTLRLAASFNLPPKEAIGIAKRFEEYIICGNDQQDNEF